MLKIRIPDFCRFRDIAPLHLAARFDAGIPHIQVDAGVIVFINGSMRWFSAEFFDFQGLLQNLSSNDILDLLFNLYDDYTDFVSRSA